MRVLRQVIIRKRLLLYLMPALLLGVFGVLSTPLPVQAASTYIVNSIGDAPDNNPGDDVCETATPGQCTLRAAIQEVNAGSGGDTIHFNITGSGVHTLTPASCYDSITESVTINGYSQTGATANTAISPNPFNGTLTIELDGSSAGSCNGLTISSSNVTVRGLVINGFEDQGINVPFGSNSNIVISGNYIGTDATGLIGIGNAENGILYRASGSGNVLGGTSAADRNIISGNSDSGLICQSGGSNLLVQGNYFGPDASGVGILPNTSVSVGGNITLTGCTNFVIGGSASAARNVVSGSRDGFIIYRSSNITIQGNSIGTNANGAIQIGFGNTEVAIALVGDSQNNLVGGTASGEGNLIAGNGGGVIVGDMLDFLLALNNSILGNSIHGNTGGSLSSLGIDLLGNSNDYITWSDIGVTANDLGDGDETSNHLMNFPVINSATKGSGEVTVNYDLDINDSEAGATGYNVSFYASTSPDHSGYGQGEFYLGSDTVAGDVTNQSVTLTLPGLVPENYYITAVTTMTDASADGFGHSSEFSAAVAATAANPGGGGGAGSDSGDSSSALADTGDNTLLLVWIALVLLVSGLAGGAVALRNRRQNIRVIGEGR